MSIKDKIELLANEFRHDNKLSSTEAIRLKSLIQKNKILTIYRDLSDEFSGMAVKISDNNITKRFMMINSNHSIGKQHFTICHELYHLFFQDDFSSATCNVGKFNKKEKEEYNADIFASCLLLPTLGVIQMIPDNEQKKNSISLKTILSLEQYYSCSRSSLLYRLLNLNLIDMEFLKSMSNNVKKNAIMYGFSTDLYEKGNKGDIISGEEYGSLAYSA